MKTVVYGSSLWFFGYMVHKKLRNAEPIVHRASVLTVLFGCTSPTALFGLIRRKHIGNINI